MEQFDANGELLQSGSEYVFVGESEEFKGFKVIVSGLSGSMSKGIVSYSPPESSWHEYWHVGKEMNFRFKNLARVNNKIVNIFDYNFKDNDEKD